MAIDATMQVIRAHGPRDYRLEEIPVPQPGPGEILIEVDAKGTTLKHPLVKGHRISMCFGVRYIAPCSRRHSPRHSTPVCELCPSSSVSDDEAVGILQRHTSVTDVFHGRPLIAHGLRGVCGEH